MSFDTSQNGFDKKKMQINASVDVGKENICTLLVGVQSGAATVEIGVEVPHKIANSSTIYPATTRTPKTSCPSSVISAYLCALLLYS